MINRKIIWSLSLLILFFPAACTPSIAPVAVTRVEKTAVPITNITPPASSDCKQGIITPEDARCYLDNAGPDQVQMIDEETAVLLADPQSIADWAGAAIIYHLPTHSMIVLDRFGDGDPQASVFSERAGLAALSELAGDAELMAGLKQQVQSMWQTSPSNVPEIRLSTAWQDGSTSVFFIAVAGLEPADDRFYCPGQTWTIADSTEEIVPDCMARQTGTPVHHFIFEAKTIKGSSARPVQVALDGVPSKVLQVREGKVAQETLIYQTVLKQIPSRPRIVRGETVSGFDEDAAQLVEAVDPALLQNYLDVNKTPYSLRFLFQDSSAFSVQPNASIERYFLPSGDPQKACAQFRSDYPGLGGVVTLSRIGMNADGTQALVHMIHECGSDDRQAAYYTLAETDDGWQVTNNFAAAAELPALMPEMDYLKKSSGCGDIFVYKSNRTRSEYVMVSIDAIAFDLSVSPLTLDLAAHPETIEARIDVYEDSVEKLGENPYCNDVGPTAVPQSVWQAVSGTVTISVSAGAQTELCAGEPYQANVLIEDVVFALGAETVQLPSLMFNDVTVGWCAG